MTEKILKSGLIDKAMVDMLVKMGSLPEDALEQVKEDALKGAPVEVLHKLADDMAGMMEDEQTFIRETHLDLRLLKWPVSGIDIYNPKTASYVAQGLTAMVDSMGRYYFRIQDVKESWFVPGYDLRRSKILHEKGGLHEQYASMIVESQVLYTNEKPVCLQVRAE